MAQGYGHRIFVRFEFRWAFATIRLK